MRPTLTAYSVALATGLALLTGASSQGAPPDAARSSRPRARPPAKGAAIHTIGGCRDLPGRQPVEHPDRPARRSPPARPRSSPGRPRAATIHLDLGSTEEYYGIPVNVVPQDQPLLPLQVRRRGRELRRRERPGPGARAQEGAHRGLEDVASQPAERRPARHRGPPGDLRPHRALQGQAGQERPGPGRRLARLVGRPLEPVVQRAAPDGLDLRRRRRAADPARPARLRRGGERRDHPRAPVHPAGGAQRLHQPGPALRLQPRHDPARRTACASGSRRASPPAATPAPPRRSSWR